MSDLYLTLNGDIAINGSKDLAKTSNQVQSDVQQVYLRLMTEPGDFYVYPRLGIDLSSLYGLPQNRETGELGKKIIRAGLEQEGLFSGRTILIEAIPISKDSIRFDVHIVSAADQPIVLSINQSLGG